MKPKITLLEHKHFGRSRLYPGCAISRVISSVADKLTFNDESVASLGKVFAIEVKKATKRPTAAKEEK